jgi:hypothetical protein
MSVLDDYLVDPKISMLAKSLTRNGKDCAIPFSWLAAQPRRCRASSEGPLPSPQPPLSLGARNRSLCPKPVIWWGDGRLFPVVLVRGGAPARRDQVEDSTLALSVEQEMPSGLSLIAAPPRNVSVVLQYA